MKQEFLFHLFKNTPSKNKQHLMGLIYRTYNNLTEEELDRLTVRIMNYQIDKYGVTLQVRDEHHTIRKHNK